MKKKEKIGLTKVEFIFLLILIFFNALIMVAFNNYLIGSTIVIATTLLLFSIFNLIKNIEAILKQKPNIKRYGLATLISYLLGSIILLAIIFYEFKISLKTTSLVIMVVYIFGILNLSLFYLNKLLAKQFNRLSAFEGKDECDE